MPSLFAASLAVAALVLIADAAGASSSHSDILARKNHHVQRAGKVAAHKAEKRAKAGTCNTKRRSGSKSPSKHGPSRNATSDGPLSMLSPYKLVQDSAGANFFDDWEFFTDADPTHGNVDYQSAAASWASNLISIGPNSLIGTDKTLAALSEPITASMKVDDTTWLSSGENRKSVRVVSKDSFKYGLLVLDAVKMPYGCSTWPAFWTVGGNWPNGGEIDIVEGVNVITTNQMTLHTSPGCTLEGEMGKSATGNILSNTCDATVNSNTGCGVQDPANTSYGAGFNAAGGGVFAMEWDADGIAMWHFERKDIPLDLHAKAPNPSKWGAPAAFWSSSSCDMNQYFDAQNIVFDITLCGDWAGAVFNQGGCSGSCTDAVMDPGNFKDAQWEVASVRLYQQK